jgi:hypothetical protein
MPLGKAFARDIVRRPCISRKLKMKRFLKEECGGLLKKRWNHDLERWFEKTFFLVSHWTRSLVGASEISCLLGGNLAVTSPNTFVGADRRGSCRDSTARP